MRRDRDPAGRRALVDVGRDPDAVDRLLERAERCALAAVEEVLRPGPSSASVSSCVAIAVGAGFTTLSIPAIGTGRSVSAPAGSGSFGSRSRTETRIDVCPELIETLSVVSYSVLPSAVATRVPAGIVSSPNAPRARLNSISPAGRPPRTRSIPSSADDVVERVAACRVDEARLVDALEQGVDPSQLERGRLGQRPHDAPDLEVGQLRLDAGRDVVDVQERAGIRELGALLRDHDRATVGGEAVVGAVAELVRLPVARTPHRDDVGRRRLLERKRVRGGRLARRRERLALGRDAAGQAREEVLEHLRVGAPAEAHDSSLSVNGPIVTVSVLPPIGWHADDDVDEMAELGRAVRVRGDADVHDLRDPRLLRQRLEHEELREFRAVSLFGMPSSSCRREPYSGWPSSASSPRGVRRRITIACARLSRPSTVRWSKSVCAPSAAVSVRRDDGTE